MEDKHAYWIPVDCNFAGDSGVYCSNCDFFVSDYTDSLEEYCHCPKCGFIMGEPIKEQMNKTTEQRAIDLLNAFTKHGVWTMKQHKRAMNRNFVAKVAVSKLKTAMCVQ